MGDFLCNNRSTAITPATYLPPLATTEQWLANPHPSRESGPRPRTSQVLPSVFDFGQALSVSKGKMTMTAVSAAKSLVIWYSILVKL